MNKTKKTSPAQVAGLAGAAIVAAGFAVWNINRALSGPGTPPPVTQPHPAADAAHATDTADSEANKPAAGTGTRPEATAAAPGTGAEPGAGEPAPVREANATAGTEAGMAPNTDPFRPLVETTPAVTIRRLPPRNPHTKAAPTLPRVGPYLNPALPKERERIPALAPPKLETPELAGTLLGEQPSAVFREERSLVLVPVGGRVGAWKVVSVSYDGAVVKHGHEVRRLAVGGSRTPGTPGAPRGGAVSAGPAMVDVQPAPAEPVASVAPSAQKVSLRDPQPAPAVTPAPPAAAPEPEPKPEPKVEEAPALPAPPLAGDPTDGSASPAADPGTGDTQPPASPR